MNTSVSPERPAGWPEAMASGVRRAGLWPLRVAWLLAALLIGGPFLRAIDRSSAPAVLVLEVALWALWFGGAVASMVPSPASLTVVRTLALSSIGWSIIGVLVSDEPQLWVALGFAVVLTVVAFQLEVGNQMVNGSAYGSERRMTLRPPAFALAGPVQVAWGLVFAGLTVGPLLLTSGRWILGVLAVAAGGGAIWLGARVLHQLARRWIVFVPAGFVIHDPVVLGESILLGRTKLAALGPVGAPLHPEAIDLGRGARGLALGVRGLEPVDFTVRTAQGFDQTSGSLLVFNPSRPGAVLSEARIRAIPIGAPEPAPVSPNDI